MIVFKTFLKILNKNKYLVIFYSLLILIMGYYNMQFDSSSINFESSKPNIYYRNYDNSKLSEDFISYIKENSNYVELGDKEEDINDAIFFRDINYYIEIPSNYMSLLIEGKNPELYIKTTNDYMANLEDRIVNRYIRLVSFYKNQVKDENEIINLVRKNLNSDVHIDFTSKSDTSMLTSMTRYYNFANYSIIASLVFIISIILNAFNNEKIFKRTTISSMDYKKYSKYLILSNLLLTFVLFLVYTLFSYFLVGNLIFSLNGIICIFNMLIFIICSTTFAILLGNLIKDKNALGGVVNVFAVGTSLLCGSFVPVEFLPDIVLTIGHIFPSYYYINSNNIAKEMEIFNFNSFSPILINYLVLFIFTIIFIILSIVVIKKNRQTRG